MLASAAAGSVLEISVDVHRLGGPCSSILGTFLLLPFLLSGRDPLADGSLCSRFYGPDEAQQFTSNCSGDLSLPCLLQPVSCNACAADVVLSTQSL